MTLDLVHPSLIVKERSYKPEKYKYSFIFDHAPRADVNPVAWKSEII